jgi:glutathione S-transferase
LWLLEEIEADYKLEIVDLKNGAQKSDAYRRLNSMMKVPTLVDDGVVVNETGAILQYVAERHPSNGLLPAIEDAGRSVCLRWLFFVGSNLEPAMAEKFNGWNPNPYYNGWGDFDRVKLAINAALAPRPWLLGERFSVADIYLSSDLRIARLGNLIAAEDEPVASYLKQTEDRAGFVRASKIDADHRERRLS